MRISSLLSFCALACLLCNGCGGLNARSGLAATAPQSALQSLPLRPNVIEIKSNLNQGQSSPWKVQAMKVAGRESLKAIYFLDKVHGWVGGQGGLYETSDGGGTWEKVKIDIPQKAKVVSIFFINPSIGWVVMQRKPSDSDYEEWEDESHYQEIHSWLMHTSDGGQSWQLQHEGQSSLIERVSFINEHEGWMSGVEIIGLSPYRIKNLLFHTLDGGEHWLYVGESVNQLIVSEDGLFTERLSDILPGKQSSATVLFLGGTIFKTNDIGLRWQQLAVLPNSMKWTHYFKLGVSEDQRLWVMGGNYGHRGIVGTLTIEQDDKLWIRSSLNETNFKDAVVLSSQQALTCGFIPIYKEGVIYIDPPEQNYGTIFYSSDGGHNWTIIYRNAQIRSINALAAIDSDHIWAVGEDGLILRLERSTS